MKSKFLNSLAIPFRAPMASPRGLAARAVLIVLAFGALHLAGLREATSVISGTTPTGQPLTQADAMLGGLYLLAWFGFVVGAPVLLLASGIMWGMERWLTRCSRSAAPRPHKSPAR